MNPDKRLEPEAFALPVLKLFKGPLSYDQDTKAWDLLLQYEPRISKYLSQIGLGIHLDREYGYAYLFQPGLGENEDETLSISLPRITVRRSFSKKETLLLILLREILREKEENHPDEPILLKREEIHELLSPFFPETHNDVERRKEYDRLISRILEHGFLRDMKNEYFKIENFLRAKVSLEDLKDIRDKFTQDREEFTE